MCFLSCNANRTPVDVPTAGRVPQTAMELARRLEAHPRISRVHYPGLPSHPDHHIAKAQMLGGFGGVISFEVRPTRTARRAARALGTPECRHPPPSTPRCCLPALSAVTALLACACFLAICLTSPHETRMHAGWVCGLSRQRGDELSGRGACLSMRR